MKQLHFALEVLPWTRRVKEHVSREKLVIGQWLSLSAFRGKCKPMLGKQSLVHCAELEWALGGDEGVVTGWIN